MTGRPGQSRVPRRPRSLGWLCWFRAFGSFWYEFLIGDDWRAAATVTAGLASTLLLAHLAHVNAWWLMPACMIAALGWSLRRATLPARGDILSPGDTPDPGGPYPPNGLRSRTTSRRTL